MIIQHVHGSFTWRVSVGSGTWLIGFTFPPWYSDSLGIIDGTNLAKTKTGGKKYWSRSRGPNPSRCKPSIFSTQTTYFNTDLLFFYSQCQKKEKKLRICLFFLFCFVSSALIPLGSFPSQQSWNLPFSRCP